MWHKLNGHVLWHIFVAWSLFITINISCLFHATIEKIDYSWNPIIKKFPWFLFLIVLIPNNLEHTKKITSSKESNTNKYFDLEMRDIIIYPNKCHKRSKTVG